MSSRCCANTQVCNPNSPGSTPKRSAPDTEPLMWITLLVMAVAVSLEPFRIGMTVLMLNRPRPILQLFAFLSGGFAMAMTVGLVVLFVFRRRLLGSSPQTLPKVQIVIGALALLVAAALVMKVLMGRFGRGCPAK